MKIESIAMSGFRGFAETETVTFGRNFTIITGRNGTGKSSICDAIEFALTGEIDRFKEITPQTRKNEAREYFWWKGGWEPKKREVCLTLVGNDGKTLKVHRNHRGDLIGINENTLFKYLVTDAEKVIGGPQKLDQIIRSSFIRDEMISELSLDLGDRDRFNFVSEIMGLYDISPYIQTLNKAHKTVKNQLEDAKTQLEDIGSRIFNMRAELSNDNRRSIPRAILVSIERIQEILSLNDPTGLDTLREARRTTIEIDSTLAQIETFPTNANRLVNERRRVDEERSELASVNKIIESLSDRISEIDRQLPDGSSPDNELRLYIELANAGTGIGLTDDGCCPLCGNETTDTQFAEHIGLIESRAQILNNLISERNQLRDQRDRSIEQRIQISASIEAVIAKEMVLIQSWNNFEASMLNTFEKFTLPGRTKEPASLDDLNNRIRELADFLSQIKKKLESDIEVAQEFPFPETLEGKESELTQLTADRDELEASLLELEKLENGLLESRRTAQRLSGRFLDDKLLELDPLLAELYTRLKPHSFWAQIRTNIRGDVRHSLALSVNSEDLTINPSFVFSSGQRRAAGLAFLTALAISNRWTRLESILFDDPVQHVDDYRALHLVECIAAICKTGKQIICTVEDPALANLMSRRILSSTSSDGQMIEMLLDSSGAHVENISPISILSTSVLTEAVHQ